MCTVKIELFVRIFLISPHLSRHVCWKDVLHQTVNNILTFQKYYIFHMNKNSYRQFLCGPHTVSKRCYILYCSLFTTFIHCWHNSTVYADSKQHKHHSTYPAKCHRYEPVHFATFPPCSTSTPLSHKRLHLTNGL